MDEARRSTPHRGVTIGAITAVVVGIIAAILLIGGSASPESPPDPSVPDPSIAQGREWDAVLRTSIGNITMVLDGAARSEERRGGKERKEAAKGTHTSSN